MIAWLLWSCKPTPELLTGLPDQVGNHPVVPEVALYPWPSSAYLEPDASTRTGFRLAIPAADRPDVGDYGIFEAMDGFSRVSPILTYIPGGVDPASLPSLAASIEPSSAVLLVRADGLLLEPVLVELDGYAPPEEQALILRPQVTLAADADYVVLILDGVKHEDGTSIVANDAFRALRDGLLTDSSTVEALREGFQVVNRVIEGLGVQPTSIVSGWTFHTRSEGQLIDPLVAMHDTMMSANLGPWVELSREHDGQNTLVRGSVMVPDFLGADDRITLGADGLPVVEGMREMPVLITLPDTVDEPRPVLVFGHGFFSSRDEPTWGSLQQSIQPWRTPVVSIDFIGFTEDDIGASFGALSGNIDRLATVIDQQRQSHANHTALVRVIQEQLGSAIELDGAGGPFLPLDVSVVNYMGISNGGTQGYTLMALSPNLSRAALVVGGGGWSHITQRASQWNTLGQLVATNYPDDRELQLVLGLMQQVFDPIDALNFADHLVTDRLPGRPPVQLSLHMAVGDAQVSNMTTEWVARSAGIPLVVPSSRAIWGLDTLDASADGVEAPAGLIVYDEGYPAVPPGNVAPMHDNGAHESIRNLLSYRENVGRFLETGRITQVCSQGCDPD